MNPNREPKAIKLSIDSCLKNIGLVGLAVQALCSYVGFGEVEAYQVQLGVVEAVTNAVKHAYGSQPGYKVTVAVAIHPDRMSFQILDTGQPMKLISPEQMEFDPANLATLPEGGMGLYIIRTVMDEVDYQTVEGDNILTMTKYFPRD